MVQTVCKGYQQTTTATLAGKELNTKQFVDTNFWLKPWLKLISCGSNYFLLAKVMGTTDSDLGKPWSDLGLNCFKGYQHTTLVGK